MGQFGIIFSHEVRKVLKRKSIWICLFGIIILYLSVELFEWAQVLDTVDVINQREERYSETYAEQIKRQRDNGLKISGKKIDDNILLDRKKYFETLRNNIQRMTSYEAMIACEKYNLLEESISNMLEEDLGSARLDIDTMTEEKIYQNREQLLLSRWQENQLSEKEVTYWSEKENLIEKPFLLQYSRFFENITGENGFILIFSLISFLTVFVTGKIFSLEHEQKTDQLILSSRFGRKEVYYAKILTGIIVSVSIYLIVTTVMLLTNFILYGIDGSNAVIQLIVGSYSYPLTMGQVTLIMLIIEFVASILTALFAMVLAEKFRSEIIALAIIIAFLFGARIIDIPISFQFISQIWNYIPVNLLDLGKGFCDMRLLSIGGIELTSWQFAPAVYVMIGIVLVFCGKSIYTKYQVH